MKTVQVAALALSVAFLWQTTTSPQLLAQAIDSGILARSKKAAYDDVRFELTNAVLNRGLEVDFNGHISNMLERTGADVGSARPIYRKAEYFTFCSAKLSRQMMEAEPLSIGLGPYVVFIYEAAAAPGTTHVGYRRLPAAGSSASQAAAAEINKLLEGIVGDAVK
jgi:hypothetical protein